MDALRRQRVGAGNLGATHGEAEERLRKELVTEREETKKLRGLLRESDANLVEKTRSVELLTEAEAKLKARVGELTKTVADKEDLMRKMQREWKALMERQGRAPRRSREPASQERGDEACGNLTPQRGV